MKVICSKEELLKGSQTVQSVVSPRSTLPILSNLLFETENQEIKLSSTDLEVGVSSYVKGEIIREGSITIPAKRFSDIVRELPDDKNIEINADESNQINIRCGKSHFILMGLPKVDYPVLPPFPKEDVFNLSCSMLRSMLRKTSFAVSTDETRYVLNGVHLMIEKGIIIMVATDGRRLAYINKKGAEENEKKEVIIPSKAVNELQKIITQNDDTDDINIGITENQIAFKVKSTTLISRLIEGTFPNYEQVIPKKYESQIKLNTKEAMSAVKQMALLASDKTSIVKFFFGKNVLRISASSQGLGSGEVEIDIEHKGSNIDISFNPLFIIDILKNIEDNEVFFEITSSHNPAVIRPVNDEKYICVIMPMRS